MRTSNPTGWRRDRARRIVKTKRPYEGGLCICDCAVDQARRSAGPLLLRRYAMKPRPTKPKIIMAQVEGSGTAATTGASIEKLPEAIVEPFKPSCTCHPFVNISKVAAGAEKFCSEVRVKITPAPPE